MVVGLETELPYILRTASLAKLCRFRVNQAFECTNYRYYQLNKKYNTRWDSFRKLNSGAKTKPILFVHEAIQNYALNEDQEICVRGWVRSVRDQKKNTFIDIIDGLSPFRLQVVADTKLTPAGLCYHSAVSISGMLVRSDHKAQDIELHASEVNLINPADLSNRQVMPDLKKSVDEIEEDDIYPFAPRKRYTDEFCRSFPEYRSKLADFGCILRIRSAATQAIHHFFLKRCNSKL